MFKRKKKAKKADQGEGAETDASIASDADQTTGEGTAVEADASTSAAADHDAKVKELVELAQRIQAEFANYKKRVAAEQEEFVRFASGQTLLTILPNLANLEKAANSVPVEFKDHPWTQGFSQSYQSLVATLRKLGLEKIPTTDTDYDPNLHEAVLQAPGPKHKVLEELESGYQFQQKVLRPAKVKVGDGSPQQPA